MNHALAVRVAESLGDLLADFANAIEGEPLALLDGVGECPALDKFHHQEWRALILADVEDGHNSGMRQNAGRARLAVESRAILFALSAFERRGMDGFESDDAADGRVAGLEDAAHGAAAQFLDNLIPANALWGRPW